MTLDIVRTLKMSCFRQNLPTVIRVVEWVGSLNFNLSSMIDEARSLRKEITKMAAVHGTLILVFALEASQIVPIPATVIGDFGGGLPLEAQQVINVSDFVRHLGFSLLVFIPLGLCIDARIYCVLRLWRGKDSARLWSRSITLVLCLLHIWFYHLLFRSFLWFVEWGYI